MAAREQVLLAQAAGRWLGRGPSQQLHTAVHPRPRLTPALPPNHRAVDILCVGPKPVQQRYSGVVRVQDVRATEIDKVPRRPAAQQQGSSAAGRAHVCSPAGRGRATQRLQGGLRCACPRASPATPPPHLAPSNLTPPTPQVKIEACFRPGDVVRAEVLSLGDARSYHLTTAKNELGVVYAKSVAGACVAGLVGASSIEWVGAAERGGGGRS